MDSNTKTLAEQRKKETRKRTTALILSLIIPGTGQFFRARVGMGIAALILDAGFVLFPVVMLGLRPDLAWLLWPLWAVTFGIYYFLVAYDSYAGPRLEKAPCRQECPAGIDVPNYVALVAQRRYSEADELIRERAPLAGVLGRVCPAPCERICTRTRIEEPIAIRALKRSAASSAGRETSGLSAVRHPRFKVAIVGAGPSGLTCAHFLARRGYAVDLFDREPSPGGLLRDIIPCFRLPSGVVTSDIDFIMGSNPGIRFYGNRTLGKDLQLDELERSYDAFYLALGASKPRPLYIEGEELAKVIPGLTFLRDVCVGTIKSFSGHVAVLGGGNTAIDSARAALRLGAKKVTVFYRRMRANMPAYPEDLAEAEREGVRFEFLAAPLKFEGKKHVSKVHFNRMRLLDYEVGRRSELVPVEGEEWVEDVQAVIVAVGQEPDLHLLNSLGLPVDLDGKIVVNPRNLKVNRPKLFAGGDAVRGPSTVVEAVADGRKTAVEIDYFLRPRFLGRFFERIGDFDPDFGLEKLKGAAWNQRVPVFKARLTEEMNHKKLGLAVETMCGLPQDKDNEEAMRCLRCQSHNLGFAYRKGDQKGYVKPDKRFAAGEKGSLRAE